MINEIKYRIGYVIIGSIIGSIVGMKEVDRIMEVIKYEGMTEMYFIDVSEGIKNTIYIGISIGLVGTIPQLWLQIYKYVCVGMYKEEQKEYIKMMLISIIMQFIGIRVGIEEIVPRIIEFYIGFDGGGGYYIPGMGEYRQHIIEVVGGVIIISQSILIGELLIKWKWIGVIGMRKGRRWYILSIIIIGSLITPPEINGQLMIYIPMIIIYEGQILREIRKIYKNRIV